jgi:hypothetical protein
MRPHRSRWGWLIRGRQNTDIRVTADYDARDDVAWQDGVTSSRNAFRKRSSLGRIG